jgi:hypothetical protein
VVVGGGGERRRSRNVHDLVAIAFIGPKPNGFGVNHLDGDKKNNAFENLEYATQDRNMKHASSIGLLSVGSKRKHSKLSERIVRVIRKMRKQGFSLSYLGRKFGVHGVTIFDADTGRTWRHVS